MWKPIYHSHPRRLTNQLLGPNWFTKWKQPRGAGYKATDLSLEPVGELVRRKAGSEPCRGAQGTSIVSQSLAQSQEWLAPRSQPRQVSTWYYPQTILLQQERLWPRVRRRCRKPYPHLVFVIGLLTQISFPAYSSLGIGQALKEVAVILEVCTLDCSKHTVYRLWSWAGVGSISPGKPCLFLLPQICFHEGRRNVGGTPCGS